MWKNAEVVGLLDREGRVRVVSRNEEEALVHEVIGRDIRDSIAPCSLERFEESFQAALVGVESQALLAGVADEGFIFWGRVRIGPSPETESPVLFHLRRLPRAWTALSVRERDAVDALNATGMNSKRAAKRLGVSLHTLNTHRRSICRKCGLHGVGEFWVFVEQCR
jgi:DNA-binding CsgD family transcriptional regulator